MLSKEVSFEHQVILKTINVENCLRPEYKRVPELSLTLN
jgi:hypothetical protein